MKQVKQYGESGSPEADHEVTQGQEFMKEVLPGESRKGGRSEDTVEVEAQHSFR